MYQPIDNEIFHVHTWRCKHAGDEPDKAYVERAVELGANRIVFTDHCPFPGNPFRNRMEMSQLEEYVEAITRMRREYAGKIDVLVGLEMEYLPSYHTFYKEIKESGKFDLLILGQHFYELPNGSMSYLEADKSKEFIGLCDAMAAGTDTGYFDVIAHPDRAFRRCKEWSEEMEKVGKVIIEAAQRENLYLEKNYSSMERKHNYWEQFWDMADGVSALYGFDAHSVQEMEEWWNRKVYRKEELL